MPTPQPSPTPVSLKTILTEAEKQTIAYRENFANLLAEEAKVFEKYDKKGKAGDKRTVESNFLVYQSAKDANSISEYRNVTRVDGKTVGDNEKRAEDFFEKVLKSTTADKELERIREENSRYDKNLVINGITLNQAVILAAHIRPFFDFKIVGREQFEGREMFVVSYQQKSKSPYISVNEDNKSDKLFIEFDVDTPGSVKELGALLRGELWIDTETFDVWRERRELTVQPNGAANPFVVIEISFDYQKSENIGITPKRIVLINYALKRKDEELKVLKQTQATFEYTKFTRSDVEVKSGEVNSTKENQ
ncbi:MAG: hypothetical protein H0X49_19130 [Acidobacteria bacterium]|nr:hypothetical protein [Acidobacteriota bacterium]